MIKELYLKNFESHEDSVIEFTDGLNLLIGQSNQGKSSIVRAIALVTANRFDKECVRIGCDFCTVKLVTDKGYVQCERGEDVNRWETFDVETKEIQRYKNMGTSVPSEALKILGMGERKRCDLFKELPNIMFQLEKHYMLSEIDGKKASSSAIARMMDDAIGIGGMEELVKVISDDFSSAKKEMSLKNTAISEKKSQLLAEEVINDLQDKLDDIKKLEGDLLEVHDLLKSAKQYFSDYTEKKSSIDRLNYSIEVRGNVLDKYNLAEGSVKKLCLFTKAKFYQDNIRNLRIRQERYTEALTQAESLRRDCQELELMYKARKLKSSISRLNNSNVDFTLIDELSGTIAENQDRIAEARKKLNTARIHYKKMLDLRKSVTAITDKYNQAEAQYNQMKVELKYCPLCGQEFQN